jgi:glycosyltransferase involved in cell wall biosynthesis
MTNATKKSQHLEILVSTMDKTSLAFLDDMFPLHKLEEFNILVINQVPENTKLKSNLENVTVINSLEKGLPQSRNIALQNASGTICLIADDDVKYVSGFKEIILTAFEKHIEADIIAFQMVDENGKLFRDYKDIVKHNEQTIYTINSVVIAFRLESVKQKVSFNPNFGLGTKFQVGNEYVFLRNALKAGLSIYFEPKIILSHPKFSSGQDIASDRLIYGRSALYYKYYGLRAYFRIAKHIYLTFSEGKLSFSEIIPKFGVAIKGIKDYKSLLKQGLEIR